MSWTTRKAEYDKLAKAIDPAVRLTTKDTWGWRALAFLLSAVTFGRMPVQRFLEIFATTLGVLVGIPSVWPDVPSELIVHEARHVHQCRIFGLYIHPWVGFPFFAIAYLLLPLPVKLAWCRFYCELDADRKGFLEVARKAKADGVRPEYLSLHLIRKAINRAESLSGPDYGWAWPRKWAMKSYLDLVDEVLKEK